MKQVRMGESSNERYGGSSFSGFYMPFVLVNSADNTDFGAEVLKLEKITLKVTLNQFGQSHLLLNDNMRTLFAKAAQGKNAWQFFNSQLNIANVLVPKAASTRAQIEMPLFIEFGGIINLKGQDSLLFEWNVPTDCLGSTVDAAQTFLYIEPIAAVGIQRYTPITSSHVIQVNSQDDTVACGNMTSWAMFFNTDKKSLSNADRVVTNLTLSSDKFGRNDNIPLIVARQRTFIDYLPAVLEPYNSFLIYAGKELQNCSINLQMTSANVNATSNFIIYQNNIIPKGLVDQIISMDKRHFDKDVAAISQNN